MVQGTVTSIRRSGLPSNPSPARSAACRKRLHAWVRQHEIDDGQREGVSTRAQRIKELEREVRELRKANGS